MCVEVLIFTNNSACFCCSFCVRVYSDVSTCGLFMYAVTYLCVRSSTCAFVASVTDDCYGCTSEFAYTNTFAYMMSTMHSAKNARFRSSVRRSRRAKRRSRDWRCSLYHVSCCCVVFLIYFLMHSTQRARGYTPTRAHHFSMCAYVCGRVRVPRLFSFRHAHRQEAHGSIEPCDRSRGRKHQPACRKSPCICMLRLRA